MNELETVKDGLLVDSIKFFGRFLPWEKSAKFDKQSEKNGNTILRTVEYNII